MKLRTSLSFLFATVDGGGNVAPAMTVARKLVSRGHRVRVISDRASDEEVRAAGAQLVPWQRAPSKPDRSRESDLIRDWAAPTPAEGLQDVLALICGRALDYAHDVLAELDREPADLVVSFDMLLGVMAGCESRGQKLVVLSTSLSMYPIPGIPPFGPGLVPATTDAERALHTAIAAGSAALFDAGLPALNSARSALGLEPLAHLYDQMNAAAVYWLGTARAFDFHADSLPSHVRYAGPLIGDPSWVAPWRSPWAAQDERPLVLVSFSTTFQNHIGCLQRVIDACARLPARVLVTLGGVVHLNELSAGENTVIVESAPHDVVMRQAHLVITHGGHGTVITALIHGLPLLVVPHGRDQADNAARVAVRGAGLTLPSTASIDELAGAVQRLLEEPAFSASARSLGQAIAAEARDSTLIEELEASAADADAPGCAGAERVELKEAHAFARRATLKGLLATSVLATQALRPRGLRAATVDKPGRLDFHELQRSIAGEVISMGSPTYAATRDAMSWNSRKSDRKPGAIVRVRSAKDVSAAVRFATAHGLKVAVRGCGHNYHNAPVRDGGLLLDLSALNTFKIDAPKLRASVQPAVKAGALVAALTPLGLAFPVGHCSDVGLGGFLLNGGVGWNGGAWGPACMSVLGIELVTATGDLVYADATHNPDLLWAARGAGPGFFGVITRYDLVLQSLPRAIVTKAVVFDVSAVDDAGDWLGEIANAAPPHVEVIYAIGANGAPAAGGTLPSSLIAVFVAFADSESQARGWLAPLDSYPSKTKVLAKPPAESVTFAGLQAMNDEDFPNGSRMTGDQCWSSSTPREILSAVREQTLSRPANGSFVFLSPNAVRVASGNAASDAAFSMHASVFFGAYGFWNEPHRDRDNLAWLKSTMRPLEPLTAGHYVGEADLSVSPERASRCFSPAAWQKLNALKKKYDPSDVFFSYLQNA